MNRGRLLKVILIIASFLLTVFVILTGEYFKKTENIKVGSIASKRFVANREVENTLATERKKAAVRKSIEPLYKQEPQIVNKAIDKIELLFSKVNATQEYLEKQKDAQDATNNNKENSTAIQSTEQDQKQQDTKKILETQQNEKAAQIKKITAKQIEELKKQSPISLSNEQFELLIAMNFDKRLELKNQCLDIVQNTFNMGIREETKTKNILDVKDQFENLTIEKEVQNLGYDIVSSVIQVNMNVDESATNRMLQEKLKEVEPVIILSGQKIVDKGEVITEEIYSILDTLGFIKKDFKEESVQYIGAILLVLLLQSFIYIYIWFFNRKVVESKKEMLLLFSIYSISMVMIKLMSPFHFSWIPIPIAGMLLAILLDVRLGMILNGYITIIGALINKQSLDFIMFFLVVGTIFSILVMNTYKRNRILWVGFVAGILNSITLISIELFINGVYTIDIIHFGFYGFISGVLSVILTVGSLPFWEVAFDVVTPIKLLELTNPDQPLLKRLLIEAPGSYYHSLLVANLAETAAADIGANSLLARVGGYYHDIGKIVYPQYFKENQLMDNPHDYMEPSVSAKIIHQHVTNGLKIAEEHKLPRAVKDMICQHHGTTLIQYFYYKAVKISSDDGIDKDEFCYEGPIPQSKEAAVIMLADTVEAAIRSMDPHEKSKEKNEELVRKLIKGKLEDGQLDDSNLTIKDLETIVQAFMKVFSGMYHERVKYPEKMEEEKNEYSDRKQHIISIKREDEETDTRGNSTSA